MTLRLLISLLLVLVYTPGLALAEPATQPSSEYTVLQSRPDRLIVELPNRLIVIAQRVPAAPVVSAQVWVKTGSIYEQEHVGAGLSHFLEHLLSGGTTTTRTEAESNAILGEIGAATNASTSLDNVRYYINTTADNAPQAIDLLSDWMQHNTISQEEYDRERSVIQREFSMGEGDPNRILWKLTNLARYAHLDADHPARHPTIGYLDEYLAVSREGIEDYYRRMYVPNNMVFVVAGDIQPEAVVDQVAGLWKGAEPRELPEIRLPVEEMERVDPLQQNPEHYRVIEGAATFPTGFVAKPLVGYADIRRSRVRVAWVGTQLGGADDYELDLVASVLGGGESSRLVRRLRDEMGLVTNVDVYNLSYPWGRGFFGIDFELANADGEAEVLDVIAQELGRMQVAAENGDHNTMPTELQRAKRKVLARVAAQGQSAEAVAARLASDVIGQGDPDYMSKYAQKVQAVTPHDLEYTARRILKPEDAFIVKLLPLPEGESPTRLTRPDAPTTQPDAAVAQWERISLDNTHLVQKLEKNVKGGDASALEIGPVREYTLDNGLRLLVQRSTVVPAVSMQMYSLGGLLADEPGREGVASAASAMLTRGTEHLTAQEINERIEDLGAGLSSGAGNNSTYIQAFALSEDWPKVMQLMAEVALRPSFPEDEWERMRPRLVASIERQNDNWASELRMAFRERYYGSHPWSQTSQGRADVVASLTAEDLEAFYRDHLSAKETVMAVVGDVDPDRVYEEVRRHFGEMPAEAKVAFAPPQPAAPVTLTEEVATRKPVAAVQIGFGPGITRDSDDYAAVQVLGTVMSDFPAGWLERELRGRDEGLVYAVSAGSATGVVPGYFTILFNTSPDAAPEAIRRAFATVERAKTQLADDTDLNRAKAKVLTGELFGRQSNSDRAMSLALDELYGIEDPDAAKFIAQMQALTAEDVRAAARKYLVNPVTVVLTNEPIEEQALDHAATQATP